MRQLSRCATVWAMVGALTAAACDWRPAEASAVSTAAAASTPAANEAPTSQPPKTACALLPSTEVDAVLGATTQSEANESNSKTGCTYSVGDRMSPRLVLEIEWGGGQAALMASGMLGRLEPGMSAKLQGLGDGASRMGPALWVRVGEDLVSFMFVGVDDDVAAAKRLLAVLRPRL